MSTRGTQPGKYNGPESTRNEKEKMARRKRSKTIQLNSRKDWFSKLTESPQLDHNP